MTSTIKTAVILAAGMGTRLDEMGLWVPKGFLKLGEKPIIEESIERLQQIGIERIIIVTGHLKEFYTELAKNYNGLIEIVYNEFYAYSGSMYSFYQVRDLIKEDFLLLESDLIYEKRALVEILGFSKDNAILLSGFTHSQDEVFIETGNNLLINMSKNRADLGEQVTGELVGICKISIDLFSVMIREAESAFIHSHHVAYETDCLVRSAVHYPIYCHLVPDLIWAEIDDLEQFTRAKNLIYPKLVGQAAAPE